MARVARLEGDRNVPGLIQELDNPHGHQYRAVRLHAVLALTRLGDPRAAPYIVPLTRDKAPVVRAASLAALGTFGHDGVVSMLLQGLADADPIVRGTAAEQLGEMGMVATGALPDLRQMVVTERDSQVRVSAAEALLRLGEEDIADHIPALVRALPWWVRRGKHWRELLEKARATRERGVK